MFVISKNQISTFHAVLKVSVKEENGNDVSVTVRLYGPNTDYFINRERELKVRLLVSVILLFICYHVYS